MKLEQGLKSELDDKKLHLEQLQEQVLKVKRLIVEETHEKELGGAGRRDKVVKQGLEEIKDIVSGLASGIPTSGPSAAAAVERSRVGGGAESGSYEQQIEELKHALPTEIARVATKIAKLEKELTQLEECKLDVTENLFQGFDEGMVGQGLEAEGGADLRNLAAWRRLNEFKSDIQDEKKKIEIEAMRVESQIIKLRESK